jgi:mono/diheme cytochrome c family protein
MKSYFGLEARMIVRAGIAAGCIAALPGAGSVPALARQGDYSQQQAAQGHQVYDAHCSQCHGAELAGQSGPALAGDQFKSQLEFSKMSGKQLYDFISTQMPYDDPGSLTKDEYLNVMAYVLAQNHYPAGDKKLTEQSVGDVKLLPYPAGSSTRVSNPK